MEIEEKPGSSEDVYDYKLNRLTDEALTERAQDGNTSCTKFCFFFWGACAGGADRRVMTLRWTPAAKNGADWWNFLRIENLFLFILAFVL